MLQLSVSVSRVVEVTRRGNETLLLPFSVKSPTKLPSHHFTYKSTSLTPLR